MPPFEPPHFGWQSNTHATVAAWWPQAGAAPRASVGGVGLRAGLASDQRPRRTPAIRGQVAKKRGRIRCLATAGGSMGTFGPDDPGVVESLPQAPAEATLVFALGQSQALQHLHGWGGQPLPLNASCWVHDPAAPGGGQDLLFVRLRGAVAAVESVLQTHALAVSGPARGPGPSASGRARCRNQTLPFLRTPVRRPGAVAAERGLNCTGTEPALGATGRVARRLALVVAAPDAGAELQALARTHGDLYAFCSATINVYEG